MMWEKIREIEHNEYTKYTQVFDVDADIEVMYQNVNSLKEFITLKYTQCVIWDRALNSPDIEDDLEIQRQAIREGTHEGPYALYVTTPQQMFLKRLNELNNAVFSRFWDDSDCDEKIFYYFALLNFKTHRYDNALRLLNKSIKQERLLEASEQNSVLRLHKRCLKAYCLEYLGLSFNATKNTELLRDAIKFLIGYDVLLIDIEKDDVIKKVMACSECDDDLCSILKILCVTSQSCMLNTLKEYYGNRIINDDDYNKYLLQIAHILSHCLSEIRVRILNDPAYQKQRSNQVLLLRIADKLMSILGEDYITCYATLKIENGEYFSSLSVLNTEREKLLIKQKKLETTIDDEKKNIALRKIERQIAQIDFYCWYFSIFAHKQIRDQVVERSKKSFLAYSQKTGDTVANTYYNVVNMKEILLKAFEDLRQDGRVSDEDKETLKKVYEEFKATEPHYSVHTTISDEWRFLKESYLILQMCCEISDDSQHSKNIELSLYKLCSMLFDLYNTPCIFSENDKIRKYRLENSFPFYTATLSSGGQIICRGNYEMLSSAMESNSIQWLSYKLPILSQNAQESEKILSDVLSKNISNIVIAVDKNNYEDDLNFIEAILKFDSESRIVDRHNIYVDLSALSNETKEFFCKMLDAKKNDFLASSVFCVNSNLKSTVLLGCAFSMLEKHLIRLGTPLNSYVISPVSEDITFDAQSCENLKFLEQADFGSIKLKYISDWGYSFGSCFPSKTKIGKSGKVLLLEKIRDYAGSIGYVFYFESTENGGIDCHAFDVVSNKTFDNRAYIYSDTIHLEGNSKKSTNAYYSADHDIAIALTRLYRISRNEQNLRETTKLHQKCKKACECFNLFTLTNDESTNYKILREYLYSHMGILLEKSVFLLLRNGSTSDKKRWVLFTLPQEINEDFEFQRKLCDRLCDIDDYIKDESVANMGVKFSNILSDSENLLISLEEKITPCTKNKKYYFISYKSKNRTAELCTPVYNDVIYLQKEFEDKLEVAIDVKNFTDEFDKEIDGYIQGQNCVGAFVYLSFDYMCPIRKEKDGQEFLLSAEQDKCFKEIELLVERKRENPDFKVFPIFIPSTSQQSHGYGSTLLELVNGAFELYNFAIHDKHDKYGNKARISIYQELFNLDYEAYREPIESLNSFFCIRKDSSAHFKANNIKNALRDYGIWNDE